MTRAWFLLSLLNVAVFAHIDPSDHGITYRTRMNLAYPGDDTPTCKAQVAKGHAGLESQIELASLMAKQSWFQLSPTQLSSSFIKLNQLPTEHRDWKWTLPSYLRYQKSKAAHDVRRSLQRVYFGGDYVWGLQVSADEFLEHSSKLFQDFPRLSHLGINGFTSVSQVFDVLSDSRLRQLTSLAIDLKSLVSTFSPSNLRSSRDQMNWYLGDALVRLQETNLLTLTSLDLSAAHLNGQNLSMLLSLCPTSLAELDLTSNDYWINRGLRGTSYIWQEHQRIFKWLTHFRLSRAELTAETAERLMSHFESLNSLDLSDNKISTYGFIQLTKQTSLKNLRDLNVSGNYLKSLWDLKTAPFRKSLVRFNLSRNPLGSDLYKNLATLDSLLELNLSETGLANEGVAKLARLKNSEGLIVLKLKGNDFTGRGLEELGTGNFANVRMLDIAASQLSEQGLESILDGFPSLEEIWAVEDRPATAAVKRAAKRFKDKGIRFFGPET